MFRIIGILLGSALSITVILLVAGIPQFHFVDNATDQKRFDAAVEKLMARKLDSVATVDPSIPAPESNSEIPVPDAQTTITPTESVPSGVIHHHEPLPDTAHRPESGTLPRVDDPVQIDQWYSFWNPFRSEIAATGFVAQLEKVTGLDYRVVKVKSGVYEVAFGYTSEEEKQARLSQISSATGLELSGS